MHHLKKLLDRKTALTARLGRVKSVMDDKSTYMVITGRLVINSDEQIYGDIMKVLFMHQEDCKEELMDIDRKIDAINELLGGL